MPRLPDPEVPDCPTHAGSRVRREGTYGKRHRQRYRCFYIDETGTTRKHGFTPLVPRQAQPAHRCESCDHQVPDFHGSPVIPGGLYTVAEAATALTDLARGMTYTEAARRARTRYWGEEHPGWRQAHTTESGQSVADWLSRFGPVIAGSYAETAWADTLVLDSTEFRWSHSGGPEQLFAVLAAWGYPAGAKKGRLWALAASPSDTKADWKKFLAALPGRPSLVVYDADKAIRPAVKETWPGVPLHLCEHHLYTNAAAALTEDGQHGMGNAYRTLLNDAARSPAQWAAFRDAVLDGGLPATLRWVRFWDKQMSAQTLWRADVPAHYSTGALDPKLADIRQHLERRRWTFRNLTRMNQLLALMRLHVNRRDNPADWALLIRAAIEKLPRLEPVRDDGTVDYRRARTWTPKLADPVTELADGSRVYTLRKHPVPARTDS
jgi:hypothetical protein